MAMVRRLSKGYGLNGALKACWRSMNAGRAKWQGSPSPLVHASDSPQQAQRELTEAAHDIVQVCKPNARQ